MNFFVILAIIVALLSGIPRRLGAPRWLAFLIPVTPLLAWLIYSLIAQQGYADEGGGMAVWTFVAMLLVLALPVSAITVFIVPGRKARPSA